MNRSLVFSVFLGAALVAAAVGGVRVLAGPLDPPGAPESTMPTLSELGATLEGIEQSLAAPDPWAVPPESNMTRATSVLLFVDGIEGSVAASGVEGAIAVLGFSHSVVSPRDAASGLPTGKRQHKPVVVTKPVDKATPLLYQALVFNQNISEITLVFYQGTREREPQVYYTIKLENVSIGSIESKSAHFEEVAFYYQKITWTFEDGGITAEDDWESPVV
jgi:type VI secretion system secreted protein Hcp